MASPGFTLIELLLVAMVVGIIAALVLPQLDGLRERAYRAAMKGDLRNTVLAQEERQEEVGAYAESAAALGVTLSADVGLILAGGRATYIAIASHAKTGTVCSVEIGELADQRIRCGGIESSWPVDHAQEPTEVSRGLGRVVFIAPSVPGRYKINDTNCRMELIRQEDGVKESQSIECPATGPRTYIFPTFGLILQTNDAYVSGNSGSYGTLHGLVITGVASP